MRDLSCIYIILKLPVLHSIAIAQQKHHFPQTHHFSIRQRQTRGTNGQLLASKASTGRRPFSSEQEGFKVLQGHRALSMVVSGSPKRWDRWQHIVHSKIGRKYTTYIPLKFTTYSPCLLGGYMLPIPPFRGTRNNH